MTIVERLRRIALVGALAGLSSAAMLSPSSAQPVRPNGYPVTNINLRAGPGTYYPALLVVPARTPIRILGCLGDYTWCDVIFQGNRGWMRSIYLQGWYQNNYYSLRDYAPRLGYAVVSFDIGRYWESNYRDRPFYRDRGKWGGSGGSYGEGWTERSSFYGRLAPYGDWIWLEGQYVWVPENVGPQWRPYTVGRWVYTDRYGWMWTSREPFGWATYHYGRWGFSRRVGWFWVPGSRWAPAWVSWRQSDDYLAWAPLPPTSDEGFSINIRIGTVPDYYWQVVPNREFLSPNLDRRIIRDKSRFNTVFQDTQILGDVTVINNNVVVNNVVNVTYVEEKTKEKVVVHTVERTTDEAKAGKVEGAAVEVFQPAPEETPKTVAPPKPKPIEEVAAQSETKEQAQGAATTEELLVPQEVQKAPEAKAAPSAPPPPPAPAADGAPSAEEEAAAPPPPGPPAEEAAPPPPEEAAPPPPSADEAPPPAKETPPPAKEAVPPPPPAEAPPAPPAAEEAAPPPPAPPAEEAPPKAKKEGKPTVKKDRGETAAPDESMPAAPPPLEEAAPPPAVEEAAPPPPAPPAAEATPKVKKESKPKFKRDTGETAAPDESMPAAPPPPPLEEAAPPPPQDMAPPPPPSGDEPPRMKREGKPKFKKDQGETAMPEAGPPPPPSEDAGAPPSDGYGQPKAKKDGKPNRGNGNGKGKGRAPAESCPEGTMPTEDGNCVPAQ